MLINRSSTVASLMPLGSQMMSDESINFSSRNEGEERVEGNRRTLQGRLAIAFRLIGTCTGAGTPQCYSPNPVTASWTWSRVLCGLSGCLVWNIHQQQYHVILASLACLRQPMRPTIALN